jgi:acetyl esterase/lipase
VEVFSSSNNRLIRCVSFFQLAARPFLKLNLAVAIVGYRVYPDGNVNIQVRDLELAYQQLSEEYPDLCGPSRTHHPIGLVVVGHSSGAHIALMMIVEQVKRLLLVQEENSEIRNVPLVDKWVGLSGPYDVSHHFDYEAARGVEELSPLKPACGYSREQFRKNSPVLRLQDFLASIQEHRELCPSLFFPSTLLVHGMEDSTVPFTATSEAARLLRACGLSNVDEYYVPRGGHPDTVVELMLGGKVPRAIVKWFMTDAASQEAPIRSKL